MPNTLAHLGIQSLVTRSIIKRADLKWVYLGCIIPDIPWILQRISRWFSDGIDPYSVLLYATIQSSFFFCLILGITLALLSTSFWRTLLILSIGSFLHLILDACEYKWANGVHLIAPFSWRLTNFGFFWPDSIWAYSLTITGLIYVIALWRKSVSSPPDLTTARIWGSILGACLYFAMPFAFREEPVKADNFYIATIRNKPERTGKEVMFDREMFYPRKEGNVLNIFTGENIHVDGINCIKPELVSVKGTFTDTDKMHITEYHVHNRLSRDIATYIGLVLVAILWLFPLTMSLRRRTKRSNPPRPLDTPPRRGT